MGRSRDSTADSREVASSSSSESVVSSSILRGRTPVDVASSSGKQRDALLDRTALDDQRAGCRRGVLHDSSVSSSASLGVVRVLGLAAWHSWAFSRSPEAGELNLEVCTGGVSTRSRGGLVDRLVAQELLDECHTSLVNCRSSSSLSSARRDVRELLVVLRAAQARDRYRSASTKHLRVEVEASARWRVRKRSARRCGRRPGTHRGW